MKKSKLLVLACILVCVLVTVFVLSSCGNMSIDTNINTDNTVNTGSDSNVNADTDSNKKETFNVTFVQGDGYPDVVKTVEKGGTLTDIPTPKRVTGYTLSWEDKDLTDVQGNITVNVIKKAIKYNIIYVLNGGANNDDNIYRYTIETSFTFFNPTKRGYEFKGWYLDEELTDRITEIELGSTEDITVYAKWGQVEQETFTVTFDSDGGTAIAPQIIVRGENADEPTPPTKYGYTFDGWYYGSYRWSFTDDTVIGNFTLTAKWRREQGTIVFSGNGKTSGVMADAKINIGETVKLPANLFQKNGYKFLGWSTSPNGVVEYQDCGEYLMSNEDTVTLYAIWIIVEYSITYETNGGINNPANPKHYTVSLGDIYLRAPILDGYDFVGWYYDSAFTRPCDKIPAGATGDITLYAQYDHERYEIIYQLDGGKNSKHNPKDFNKDEQVILEDPSKNGYIFKGWYKDSAFTEVTTGINKGTTRIVTVYAKWEIITYNMEYVINGNVAKVNPANPTTYTIETKQELLPPSNIKPGYTFEGWFTEGAYENALDSFDKTYEVRRLYAKITANEYTIEYNANGGSVSDENPIKYTVENVGDKKLVVIDSERSGYKFLGWYLNDEFKGDAITEIPASTLANIQLFAKWEIETYNITYVLNGGVNAETNGATYTVEAYVTFAKPTTEKDTYFLGWYEDAEFTTAITSTQGKTGNITVYAKWWDKLTSPTMKLDTTTGVTVVANDDNPRKDQAANIFDGNKTSPGIYSAGKDWYGNAGDYLKITFDESVSIESIKVYGAGNYTTSKVTAYDEEGNEVASGRIVFNGGAYDNLSYTVDFREAVMVKTLKVEITGIKWNDGKTHKISEIEIFVTNPDYVD